MACVRQQLVPRQREEAESKGADPEAVTPLPHWRFHDLRRTVATHMEELGIPPHIVGSVLNHDPKSYKGITSVYTRGDLIFERRKALTAWARFISLYLALSRFFSMELDGFAFQSFLAPKQKQRQHALMSSVA